MSYLFLFGFLSGDFRAHRRRSFRGRAQIGLHLLEGRLDGVVVGLQPVELRFAAAPLIDQLGDVFGFRRAVGLERGLRFLEIGDARLQRRSLGVELVRAARRVGLQPRLVVE